MVLSPNVIIPYYQEYMRIYSRFKHRYLLNFCCEVMEHAVREAGWVKYTNIVDLSDPDYDTYYIEVVKEKTKKLLGTEVITEDVILKYCVFCGKVL